MGEWAREARVVIRLTALQAERLQRDWYYRQASYATGDDGRVEMVFGESDPAVVAELVRWLGPGAEIVEPAAWRSLLRAELAAMVSVYNEAV
jgi:predicted DNA-binding transcriptional regulator YafY